jgi:hypothetical protein
MNRQELYEQIERYKEDIASLEEALACVREGYAYKVLMEKKVLLEGFLEAYEEYFSRLK